MVAVAVYHAAGLETEQGIDGFIGIDAPALVFAVLTQLFHRICLNADGGALVQVIQAVAVGECCGSDKSK